MQSSPPENRAKQTAIPGPSSQRVNAVVSRTNSHDLTTKTGRSQKVNLHCVILDFEGHF